MAQEWTKAVGVRCNPPLSLSLSLPISVSSPSQTMAPEFFLLYPPRTVFRTPILFSLESRNNRIEITFEIAFWLIWIFAIKYDVMNERRVDEHRFEGSGGRKGRNCWMNGAIINRFPRQCAEARKVRRGEVEKRKEETRRDASPRYAYVLAHGERRVFPFWSPKASCSVTKYVDGIDT